MQESVRLHQRLEELKTIGWNPDLGVVALEGDDYNKQARDKVIGWMQEAGLEVTTDKIGNIIGILKGTDKEADQAPVIIGSHIDTVTTGGKLDGRYGVIAGIEAIEDLKRKRVKPKRTIIIAAWTGEEGARFQPSMMGSRAACDKSKLDEGLNAKSILPNEEHLTLRSELKRIGALGGGEPGSFLPADLSRAQYIEMHIEQGPVLEKTQKSVAVVNAIFGNSQRKITVTSSHGNSDAVYRAIADLTEFVNSRISKGVTERGTVGSIYGNKSQDILQPAVSITFTGQSDHAGTCPMDQRKDAAIAVAELINHHLSEDAKVDAITISPGAINVVPGNATLEVSNANEETLRQNAQAIAAKRNLKVEIKPVTITSRVTSATMTTDMRDIDENNILAAHHDMAARIEELKKKYEVDIEIQQLARIKPVLFDKKLVDETQKIAKSKAREAFYDSALPSGAGHDAYNFAAIGVPTAMIFVPSKGGISHNMREDTDQKDLDIGCNVLTQVVHDLSQQHAKNSGIRHSAI